jgi:hypothetical protein
MSAEKQALLFAERGDQLPADENMAVLEMPVEFSGAWRRTRHQTLADAALASQFGDEIEALRQLERAIATAEKAVELGRREVRLEAVGVSEVEFDRLAAPVGSARRRGCVVARRTALRSFASLIWSTAWSEQQRPLRSRAVSTSKTTTKKTAA